MARYETEDGTVVDVDKATARWDEDTYWNGQNHISKATGDQWLHQTLYKSRKGRYYILHTSQWQGSRDQVEFVSNKAAARWLVLNDHNIPEDLAKYADEATE